MGTSNPVRICAGSSIGTGLAILGIETDGRILNPCSVDNMLWINPTGKGNFVFCHSSSASISTLLVQWHAPSSMRFIFSLLSPETSNMTTIFKPNHSSALRGKCSFYTLYHRRKKTNVIDETVSDLVKSFEVSREAEKIVRFRKGQI
jgi:endoglucanase Acf2